MSLVSFDANKISDQKRLVRGEHLLLARTILRARDAVHHYRWRVMMLAGGKPDEEIGALRELMPKAHITAVDREPECLLRAADAGADEIIQCDLTDWSRIETEERWNPTRIEVTMPILTLEKFDLMILDLCMNVSGDLSDIARRYRLRLCGGGVFILCFSYGRDVAEIFTEPRTGKQPRDLEQVNAVEEVLAAKGAAKSIIGRLRYIFNADMFGRIRSVMLYRGATMPMCSVLVSAGPRIDPSDISFTKVEPGDFELAVTCPDPSMLYACPQERIEELRRSHAAIKAGYTRKANKDFNGQALLPLQVDAPD